MRQRQKIFFAVLLFSLFVNPSLFSIYSQEDDAQVFPPPNEQAVFDWNGSEFTLDYNGQAIFRAGVVNEGTEITFNQIVDNENGIINQVFKWSSRSKPIELIGLVYSSNESFPCEADRKSEGPDIVRHSVGLSSSLLNRGVYDRNSDWVLSVDFPSEVQVIPNRFSDAPYKFKIIISGYDIILRFRPYFYQKHRGIKFYEPWTYQVWKEPVAGWCSWFAYFQDITEEKIKNAADVISEKLAPYGFEYLQIDDGYQQVPAGTPETWLIPNEKFPSGLKSLSDYITGKELKPGIWTYTSFHQKDFASAHKEYFVLDVKDEPAYGNWVGYVLDGSNPNALNDIIKPIYKGFKETGWKYFKVDALRHLRYEGYNSYSQYFEKKNLDLVETYRTFVKTIRNEIGPDNFMLGCWGIRPELIGIIDGCRIGGDGFGYAGLAQYNSFNNVIWRNDPDHIELSKKEAYRSSMVTSLTGSLFMLTDKPEVYKTEIVEAAIRSTPVLFTLPGQLYDVDPSRSMNLNLVNSELCGDGPTSFDADRNPRCNLFLLEINKEYEDWMVLGRTGGDDRGIKFKYLGLPPDEEYAVFEFWTKKYLGVFRNEFVFAEIDSYYNCQLFCIRKKLPHPQLIATNRHVSCGGLELTDLQWNGSALSGGSEIVINDSYELYITEPEEFEFSGILCSGADIISNQPINDIRIIKLKSDKNKLIRWVINYKNK